MSKWKWHFIWVRIFVVVLNEKDILFWILQYYCMWPDLPQYMDCWVNDLCGPLRFVFEYPCCKLSSKYFFPQDSSLLPALISLRMFVLILIVNVCMCVAGVETAIHALCVPGGFKTGGINKKHPSTPVNVPVVCRRLATWNAVPWRQTETHCPLWALPYCCCLFAYWIADGPRNKLWSFMTTLLQ